MQNIVANNGIGKSETPSCSLVEQSEEEPHLEKLIRSSLLAAVSFVIEIKFFIILEEEAQIQIKLIEWVSI